MEIRSAQRRGVMAEERAQRRVSVQRQKREVEQVAQIGEKVGRHIPLRTMHRCLQSQRVAFVREVPPFPQAEVIRINIQVSHAL